MSKWWAMWKMSEGRWIFSQWLWGTEPELTELANHYIACQFKVGHQHPYYLISSSDRPHRLLGQGASW